MTRAPTPPKRSRRRHRSRRPTPDHERVFDDFARHLTRRLTEPTPNGSHIRPAGAAPGECAGSNPSDPTFLPEET